MKKEKYETESFSKDISSEGGKRINEVLLYEKWRDDGKGDHKKRDIEKKIKKQNARIKANKVNKLEDKK